VLATALIFFFGFFAGGDAGRGEIRSVYLLTLLSYLFFYFSPGRRVRAIFLAGALLVFASWATFEVAGSGSTSIVPFQSEISTSTNGSATTNFGLTDNSSFSSVDDNTESTATVALVIGVVFLAMGALLDRKRYAGAATPFVAVGRASRRSPVPSC